MSGAALQSALAALAPEQPLAFNDALAGAARTHDAAMIAADTQSHQLPGEADLGSRITSAGYAGWSSLGENVYAFSDDPLFAQAGFVIDWGSGPNGMQPDAGHRANIYGASYREVGIGITVESNPATNVGPQVVTEDFGRRSGSGVFVLGVAYRDGDHDGFYSVGEGVAGLSVSVGAGGTSSSSSGGYTLATSATGSRTITLSGGGLSGTATFTTTLADGENLKLDIVDGATLRTSASGTVGGAVAAIVALGTIGLSLATDDRSHTITGTAGSDTITAGAGDDRIDGGLGVNSLTGGAGDDTAVFAVASAAATVRTAPDGTVTVTAAGLADTLIGFEHLAFTDRTVDLGPPAPYPQNLFGTITHDPHATGGEVYALYDGLLGRAPDPLGLEYWAQRFEAGVPASTLAAAFLASPEGQGRAGALGNADFVEQLYGSTLHRHSDPGGLAYWTGMLDAGQARAEVGTGFALSAEHLADIRPALDPGLFVPDATASAVARIYYTVLGRAPDAGGLQYWTGLVKGGASLSVETAAFLGTPESQARTSGLTTAQYVDLVYENALGRHADADGLRDWTAAIDGHAATRVDVTTAIGQSPEAQTHHLAEIEQGWHLA